ncbi:NUDIX domain-containing protein [Streptomyces sp. NPDC048018]|uniref:NUDIX domain-containing protein n=1 Tax=Streptomyces sp. NPDC048018 TaxID=3365499 RepID=UPI003717E30B
MTPTSMPDDPSGPAPTDEEYGALRASAALWAGTSVLITNALGQVLVQHVDYLETCLLPGGAVDRGESPAHAASRELHEELGVTAVVDRGLGVDWVSRETMGAPPALRFPGELLHVFDGGTWDDARIGAIRLPESEIKAIDFVEPARLPDLMTPRDARRALSALRARVNGAGAVILENGVPIAPGVLDRAGTLSTPRPRDHAALHRGPVPAGLPVGTCSGWLFAPDGRVLLLLDPDTGLAALPGGPPTPADDGDVAATLVRTAAEGAVAHLTDPVYVGHLAEPDAPCARVRWAAALTGLGPAVEAGYRCRRALATPEQAVQLFDWGPQTADQLTAVHEARQRLGLPRAALQALTELALPVAWPSTGPHPTVQGSG